MSTVELGNGFSTPTPARDELVFRSDIERLIERAARDSERRLEQLVKALVPKEAPVPVVNVPPANVTVEAPSVTITPEAPESPDVNVTMPGMTDLCTQITALRTDVQSLASLLARPVIRTVTRDSNGLITQIVERRG